MQLEIELKAWVHDPAALRQRLEVHGARLLRTYRKEDRYFRSAGQDVRIRIDGDDAVVTFKDKRLVDGLEINDEHEFGVSDPRTMADLLARLGAIPLVEKIKVGEAWQLGGLLLEISEVLGLGNFIELEQVIEAPPADETVRQARIRQAETEIRTTLAALGIPDSAIEPRTYTGMLRDRQSGNT